MSEYNEIQSPPDRYTLLDQKGLLEFCEIKDIEQLKEEESRREAHWSESIAIGSKGFIESTQDRLGSMGYSRRVEERDDQCILREDLEPYTIHFAPEKELLRPKNSYIWDDNAYESVC